MHGKRVNMFAAGAVCALIGVDEKHVRAAIENIFEGKGDELITRERHPRGCGCGGGARPDVEFTVDQPTPAARWLISGNQALALGALRAGVRFVGCYPITPATDLVKWLAPHLTELGGRLVLGEDELASINLTLGASYAGTPAMTVTSGPGFSLMIETWVLRSRPRSRWC